MCEQMWINTEFLDPVLAIKHLQILYYFLIIFLVQTSKMPHEVAVYTTKPKMKVYTTKSKKKKMKTNTTNNKKSDDEDYTPTGNSLKRKYVQKHVEEGRIVTGKGVWRCFQTPIVEIKDVEDKKIMKMIK